MLDLIVIGLSQAAAGNPAAPVEPPAAAEQAPQSAAERIYCRVERTTGSRVRAQRVCRSERQMLDQRRAWDNTARHGNAQPATIGPGGGSGG